VQRVEPGVGRVTARVIPGDPGSTVVLTCEHASNRLPAPWTWPDCDAWIQDTHWAWDPGAADATMEIAALLGATAVLATFSRLLVDPNRDPGRADLIRTRAEGRPLQLNASLDAATHAQRLLLHAGYHRAVGELVAARPGGLVFSVHSFTPHLPPDPPRWMELGVLFDQATAEAETLALGLSERGWTVGRNEPYSGIGGLMYAAERHAEASGGTALELEIRQDICTDPARRAVLVRDVAAALVPILRG